MTTNTPTNAMDLLQRMFQVELAFIHSHDKDIESLRTAFHEQVVVHEAASLPYGGDWRGLSGVAALFDAMQNAWSEIRVEGMQAAIAGDLVLMTCVLHLTSRANGRSLSQPFVEVLRFKDGLLLEGRRFISTLPNSLHISP